MAVPIDFTSQDFLRNPATGLGRMRAAGPVVEVRFPIVGRTWVTTQGKPGLHAPQGRRCYRRHAVVMEPRILAIAEELAAEGGAAGLVDH